MNEEKITTSDNKKLESRRKYKRVKGYLDAFRTNDMMTSLIFGSITGK